MFVFFKQQAIICKTFPLKLLRNTNYPGEYNCLQAWATSNRQQIFSATTYDSLVCIFFCIT